MMLLSPLAVLVPVGVVALVGGIVAFVRGKKAEPPPMPVDETKTATADEKKAEPARDQGSKCKRTGQMYDATRYHSPAPVLAALQKLGYPAQDLTSDAGKQEVIKFQTMAVALGLPGMKGAGPEWIDGIPGACTLLALAEAEDMYARGHWSGPGQG